jgi:hypothetical protein
VEGMERNEEEKTKKEEGMTEKGEKDEEEG